MAQEEHPLFSPAMQSEELSPVGKTVLDASQDNGSSSRNTTAIAPPTVSKKAGTMPVCTTSFSSVPRFEETSLQSADSPSMTKASNTLLKQSSETEMPALLSTVPDVPCHILEVVADAATNNSRPCSVSTKPPSALVEESSRVVEDALVDNQVLSHTAPTGTLEGAAGFLQPASQIPLLVRFAVFHGCGTSLTLNLCSQWLRKALRPLYPAQRLNQTKKSSWIHPQCLHCLKLP